MKKKKTQLVWNALVDQISVSSMFSLDMETITNVVYSSDFLLFQDNVAHIVIVPRVAIFVVSVHYLCCASVEFVATISHLYVHVHSVLLTTMKKCWENLQGAKLYNTWFSNVKSLL
jgi:hypothetical protein